MHVLEEPSKEYYARIFDGVTNAVVFVVDANSRDVIYVNPFYEEFWGQSCQSLYRDAASWLNRIVDDDKQRIEAAFRRMMDQDGAGQFDQAYRIVTRDGVTRWVSDRAHPISMHPGHGDYRMGFVHDVTPLDIEVKRVELLSARERDVFGLLVSGQSVTETAGQMGLDFRTIGTYKSRILQKLKCDTDADLLKFAIRTKLVPML